MPALDVPPTNGELHTTDHHCSDCGALLFRAADAFVDRVGDLCFSGPASSQRLSERADLSGSVSRVALHCAACDSPVGHVFPDGPFPTGLRYRPESRVVPFRPRH